MEEIIFINKRAKIYNLIKKLSDYYGGDDIEWLREYAKEVTLKNKDNLQVTMECFEDLWENRVNYKQKV